MPKVEQYRPDQVRTQVVAAPRDPMKAQTGGIFNVVEGVLKSTVIVADADQKERERVGLVRAEEATVNLERAKNDLFYNVKDGYLNSAGIDSYDRAKETNDSLVKLVKHHGSKLTDLKARAAYDKVAQNFITRGQLEVQRHARKGIDSYEKETSAAIIENTFENALSDWGDSREFKVQLKTGTDELSLSLERSGVTGPGRDEKIQTYRSKMAATAITAATAAHSDAGDQAMENYGDLLEESDMLKMNKLIEDKRKTDDAERIAQNSVTEGLRFAEQYEGRESDMIKAINREYKGDAKMNKYVTSEATRRARVNRHVKLTQSNDAYIQFQRDISFGAKTGAAIEAAGGAFRDLTPSQQKTIRAGNFIVTDQRLYHQLMSMTMKEILDEDLSRHVDSINPADLKNVISKYNNAQSGKHSIYNQTKSQAINRARDSAVGVDPNEELSNKWYIESQQLIDEAQSNTVSGQLTPVELENVLKNAVTDFDSGNWFTSMFGGSSDRDAKNTPLPHLSRMNQVRVELGGAGDSELDLSIVNAYDSLIKTNHKITYNNLRNRMKELKDGTE